MLNRIVVINSKIYAKANLLIGEAASIQLVAENNVGKSSLINTLNFLYILNQRDWKFGDNTANETISHYFHTIEKSFVVFEIVKNIPYCLIVKRSDKSELNYYKIDCRYEDEIFYKEENQKFESRTFKHINAFLAQKGIAVTKLDKDELYRIVYNTEKSQNPVVLITDKVKRSGGGFKNSFTQMYEYLIKANDISEESFRKALIIADNKQDQNLEVFTNREQDKLAEFEKKRQKYHILESIETDFNVFKLKYKRYEQLKDICGKLRYNFLEKYNAEARKLGTETDKEGIEAIHIRSLKTQIDEVLQKDLAELNQKIGGINGAQSGIERELDKKKLVLAEIDQYKKGTIPYSSLNSEVDNLRAAYEELIHQHSLLSKPDTTEKSLTIEISQLEAEVKKLKTQISNFADLAHQHISDDPKIRQKIFSYLREEVLNQPKEKIVKKIVTIKKNLELFDGIIDVSKVELQSIPDIKILKEKSDNTTKVLEEKKSLFAALKNIEVLENKKYEAERSYYQKKDFLNRVNNRQTFELELESLVKLLEERKAEILELTNAIETKKFEIKNKSKEYERLKDAFDGKVKKLEELRKWNAEVKERSNIPKVEELLEDYTLEELYQEFNKSYRELHNLQDEIKESIGGFQRKLDADVNDWKTFVLQTQEELDTLPDLKRNIDHLFETNIASIINSVNRFITEYYNFKNYVRRFNQRIADYPVSNIIRTTIHAEDNSVLLNELSRIGKVDSGGLFSFSQENRDSLELLKRKFDDNKVIDFKELFDIEVEIELSNGIKKKVKLGKKIESEGTDAVLKLFLFLSVIRELAVNQSDNKIVVYFDELGKIGSKNVAQVVKFCEENSFVPVFAAPYFIEGINKYIPIKPSSKKQGIVIDSINEVSLRKKHADTTI